MSLIGLLVYTRVPASETYLITHTPEHRRSTILGVYWFASQEIGGLFTPVV